MKKNRSAFIGALCFLIAMCAAISGATAHSWTEHVENMEHFSFKVSYGEEGETIECKDGTVWTVSKLPDGTPRDFYKELKIGDHDYKIKTTYSTTYWVFEDPLGVDQNAALLVPVPQLINFPRPFGYYVTKGGAVNE